MMIDPSNDPRPEKSSQTPPIPRSELLIHLSYDPHNRGQGLSQVILGGQDGLVNTLGVILGVAAATADTRIIAAAGLAATFAESVSMAAVAYTSMLADQAFYESEKAREYRHVEMLPAVEREEIRSLYANKGFEGELLDQIVEKITSDPDTWVGVMMREEHQLRPIRRLDALRSSLVVGVSAMVGALIPLVPFFVLPVSAGIPTSMGLSALTLFCVGVFKAHRTVGHAGRSGLEMAVIGMVSALVGYGIGLLFRLPGG